MEFIDLATNLYELALPTIEYNNIKNKEQEQETEAILKASTEKFFTEYFIPYITKEAKKGKLETVCCLTNDKYINDFLWKSAKKSKYYVLGKSKIVNSKNQCDFFEEKLSYKISKSYFEYLLTKYNLLYINTPKSEAEYKYGKTLYPDKYYFYNIAWDKETIKKYQTKKEETSSVQKERNKLTKSLRYDILKRDGFKCQICGRTAQDDNVKLHVDHIIPVSKGGKTIPSNLRTLCQDCNLGKSNKLEVFTIEEEKQ